jgi:hypothetical protein
VTDEFGIGVPGVEVTWAVAVGTGEFGPNRKPLVVAVTDRRGLSEVWFRPTAPGVTSVSASGAGLLNSPLTFTARTAGYFFEIPFGPLFDCGEPNLFNEPRDPIPVGAEVAWEYMDWVWPTCQARIVSTSVPPGGEPFDSGYLWPGDAFIFTPRVPGDWTYTDILNGGGGTLRVR